MQQTIKSRQGRPSPPLFQRGVLPPFSKGRLGGILQINVVIITPATKYINVVIPAKAGIQAGTGCRIKSGMTE